MTEWRSPREQQIIYYFFIDTAYEPQKLSFLLRLSYDLGVPYEDLFEFHYWASNLFGRMPMSLQHYQLEFACKYDPLQAAGILSNGKVNNTNLWKVCAVCAKLATKVGGGEWSDHISNLIMYCYGFDAPWGWHLRRVIRMQPREAFESAEYCQQFAEWYIAWLNKTEKDSWDEMGVPICSISHRDDVVVLE